MKPAGIKPFIIPIFIPHQGCPHRCGFCNQSAITGVRRQRPSSADIRQSIVHALELYQPQHYPVQIAFYGGNFLGLTEVDIEAILSVTEDFVRSETIQSIRFSTRPDTINTRILELIEKYSVATIELGAQSMHDHILMQADRGHTAIDTVNACRLLQKHGYQVGLQMMVGLPGESRQMSLLSGKRIAALKPDFVRIYPTVVLAGSPFGRRFQAGLFAPLALEEAVESVKDLYLMFQENRIPVIRMGLQASDELDDSANVLAGPYHPAFGHLVFSRIFLEKAIKQINMLPKEDLTQGRVIVGVNPRRISQMRGIKNHNINILREKFALETIQVVPLNQLTLDEVTLLPSKSS